MIDIYLLQLFDISTQLDSLSLLDDSDSLSTTKGVAGVTPPWRAWTAELCLAFPFDAPV